jgi:hypothetical protein
VVQLQASCLNDENLQCTDLVPDHPLHNYLPKLHSLAYRLIFNETISSLTPNLYQVTLDELVVEGLSKRSRRALDNDTSSLKGSDLGVSVTLSTTDNSTSVSHSPTRRRRDTSDEADNGLVGGVVLLQEVCGVLLSRATDLANHDDAVRLLILQEDLQTVNEVGSGEGVTANADDERLTKAGLGGLVDGFVGEGSRAGDDTDAAALVDEAWHDSDFALALKVCQIGGGI